VRDHVGHAGGDDDPSRQRARYARRRDAERERPQRQEEVPFDDLLESAASWRARKKTSADALVFGAETWLYCRTPDKIQELRERNRGKYPDFFTTTMCFPEAIAYAACTGTSKHSNSWAKLDGSAEGKAGKLGWDEKAYGTLALFCGEGPVSANSVCERGFVAVPWRVTF